MLRRSKPQQLGLLSSSLQPATLLLLLFVHLSLLESEFLASFGLSSGVVLADRRPRSIIRGNSLLKKYPLSNRADRSDNIEMQPLKGSGGGDDAGPSGSGPSESGPSGKRGVKKNLMWYQKAGFTIFGPYTTAAKVAALQKIVESKDTDKTTKATAKNYMDALLKLEKLKKSKDEIKITQAKKEVKDTSNKL